jgi:hypothetical protein
MDYCWRLRAVIINQTTYSDEDLAAPYIHLIRLSE